MSHSLRRVLTLVSFSVACFLPRPTWTAVMTFDALAPDFSEVPSYTEDDVAFAAVNGAPDHFHPDDNFDNGTTGALIFGSDGNPFRISFAGGALFSLVSIAVFNIDTGSDPIVFTTSGGATQTVSSLGTVSFGSAFAQVAFV